MSEGLDSESAEAREPEKDIWDWVLQHDDDAELSMAVTSLDGKVLSEGTIRPGDVRETFANPDYQEMMRRGAERAREIKAAQETPETLPAPDSQA